ncbi:MAG: carbohydrate kinase family protein [Lachnospiraceae bacterium]|nr:carbohydrate kinase family protein [Lachnospiraceae bacterium]
MGKKVIAAGHICIDITPVFPDTKAEELSQVLQPGKLIQMGRAEVSTGGSVANTGLAMKLLGADVTLMGKIGSDEFGDMICQILSKYDAQEGMIRSETESTSYSVVLAVPGIDRIFLHNSGANDAYFAADLDEKALQEAVHFHFGYPPLMRSMYAEGGRELEALLKRVKAEGLSTSLDMAGVDPHSEAGKADWRAILERVMPYVDFFVPSAEELCFMLDRPRFEQWQQRAGGRDITEILKWEEDIRPLARQCMELGAKVVLIKCGAPGLYYCSAGRERLEQIGSRVKLDAAAWENREGFERSYRPERILSGTGAGDTSIAGFLTGMLEGESLEDCVRLAAATGACCVAAYDALSGLRPLEELKEKIRLGWEKC